MLIVDGIKMTFDINTVMLFFAIVVVVVSLLLSCCCCYYDDLIRGDSPRA